jgi:hypothetical protein
VKLILFWPTSLISSHNLSEVVHFLVCDLLLYWFPLSAKWICNECALLFYFFIISCDGSSCLQPTACTISLFSILWCPVVYLNVNTLLSVENLNNEGVNLQSLRVKICQVTHVVCNIGYLHIVFWLLQGSFMNVPFGHIGYSIYKLLMYFSSRRFYESRCTVILILFLHIEYVFSVQGILVF